MRFAAAAAAAATEFHYALAALVPGFLRIFVLVKMPSGPLPLVLIFARSHGCCSFLFFSLNVLRICQYMKLLMNAPVERSMGVRSSSRATPLQTPRAHRAVEFPAAETSKRKKSDFQDPIASSLGTADSCLLFPSVYS